MYSFCLLLFLAYAGWVRLPVQAEFTARLVNELDHEIQRVLKDHPQNIQRREQVG